MPSNKDRLYIALYARGGRSVMPGGEDKYHWAILVGPRIECDDVVENEGKRYHAKERFLSASGQHGSHWIYDEKSTSMLATSMILVRVVIGKVKNRDRLTTILRSIPIRGEQPGWNCVGWVQEAVEALGHDGGALGTSVTNWATIRDTLLWYVQHKTAEHRFDGKDKPGQFDHKKVATYDMVDQKAETVP